MGKHPNEPDWEIKNGLMIEFKNPTTGDTALIASSKGLMQLGWSRSQAKQEIWKQLRQMRAAGFVRAVFSR